VTEDQAAIEVELTDGRRLTKFVDASIGNLARPLSDRQLDTKFRDQAVRALPPPQVDEVLASCWRLDAMDAVGELVAGTIPLAAAASR
jgi:2-methylcitrate dehydratase PrpD